MWPTRPFGDAGGVHFIIQVEAASRRGLTQALGCKNMNLPCHLVRFFGCMIGLFFVASDVADVLGFVPYSEETPPWAERLFHSVPTMFVGLVLLAPVRYFLRDARFMILVAAYAVAIAWAAYPAISGLSAYVAGGRHWGIVPASLVPLGFIAANAAALLFRRWQAARPPDNSFKPTSLRGPA